MRYRYECDVCGEFEIEHPHTDHLAKCPTCESSVRRLVPKRISVVYKAWGFYSTDKSLKSEPWDVSPRQREKMLEPEKGYASDKAR